MRDETVTTRRTEEAALPFIVTTKRPMPIDGTPGDGSVVRAVATLEGQPGIADVRKAEHMASQPQGLGYTLPDGTTIQVEMSAWDWLASDAGVGHTVWGHMAACGDAQAQSQILAAFNAKQAG